MTKYERFAAIGNSIIGFGVAVGIFSASIDVDHSTSAGAMDCVIWGCAIGLVLILVGFAMCNLHKVEGCIVSATLVVCAWLYSKAHIKSETGKLCYRIVRKAGGYVDAFDLCYDAYVSES